MSVQIKENISLINFSSYKTGGIAKYFVLPENTEQLTESIYWAMAKKIPYAVVGWGANLLFSDDGFDGLIICMRNFEKWCLRKNNDIYAGAGTLLNDIVSYSCEEGLKGMENLAGIPGTVGGAIKMNAGAFGTEMKDIIKNITVLDYDGSTRLITNEEIEFEYRRAKGIEKMIVLAAHIGLSPADSTEIHADRKEILAKRVEKQPLELPSCGSVFKRPANGYAGQYIEECGLKGYIIGGAQVSPKHANFIVNIGNATSTDIYNLIQHVKKTVYAQKGVLLHEEVRYIGEFKKG